MPLPIVDHLLEVVADVLLVEVVLLAARLVPVGGPVSRAVRRQHLVDQDDLVGPAAVGVQGVAELELRIRQDNTSLSGIGRSGGVDRQRHGTQPLDDLLPGNGRRLLEIERLVVAAGGLGRRRENGLGQLVAVAQTRRQRDAADGPALLIFPPAGAGEIPPHDELHRHDLRGPADHDPTFQHGPLLFGQLRLVVRIVGKNVIADETEPADEVEPPEADLGEQAPLAGDRGRQHHVESADPIGRHDEQSRCRAGSPRQWIDVADLALAAARQLYISVRERLARHGVGHRGHRRTVAPVGLVDEPSRATRFRPDSPPVSEAFGSVPERPVKGGKIAPDRIGTTIVFPRQNAWNDRPDDVLTTWHFTDWHASIRCV